VFCDLSPLSSPDRVLPALAYALGVRDAAGDRLAEGAAARARDLEPLLVLDCFERVIEAGPAVAAVLAGAPGLTVLATSRRRLGLNGEFVYEVPPLDSECALSLFCERAQAVLSRFRLTERNRNPIEAICRRLDGLPLALELAAARIAVLAPAELLSRLERRRLALTGGARDLPERQRTLEAAIASSYELLDEASQQTFDRLGLFASPFTLTAAEAIAEASLDDVTRLVEMSLLVRADDGGDEARLHMLDTIRDFARERLERGAEADTLRGRHAAFFSHLYEDGHATVRDVEELRAAYAHARAHDERESALRLARGLAHLLGLGLELAEARRVLEEALSFARAETPIRGHALLTLANALLDQGEDPAQPEREAFAIFDRLGDHDHVALALGRRATRLAQRGKIKLAKVAADDCLARLDAVSAENGPMVTFVLAGAYAAIGDAPDIEARLEIEAVAAFRSRGDRVRLAMALNNFAIGAIDRGDFDAAGRALREAHAIAMEIGSVTTILGVEVNSGWYELVRGDPAAAELRFRNGFGDRDGTRAEPRRRLAAEILLGLAASAAAQGRLARAARLAGAARRTLSRTRQNRLAHLERRIEEHDLAAARSELGDAVFSRHYEEGQALRFDEAVAYALTE
jgi:predicted ATPase